MNCIVGKWECGHLMVGKCPCCQESTNHLLYVSVVFAQDVSLYFIAWLLCFLDLILKGSKQKKTDCGCLCHNSHEHVMPMLKFLWFLGSFWCQFKNFFRAESVEAHFKTKILSVCISCAPLGQRRSQSPENRRVNIPGQVGLAMEYTSIVVWNLESCLYERSRQSFLAKTATSNW